VKVHLLWRGGTALCEKIQGNTIDTRYVPLGAYGMGIFIIVLCVLVFMFSRNPPTHSYSLMEFFKNPLGWFIIVDVLLFTLFAGLYVVPLNTVIQHWTEKEHMSRVIASLNIINAFYMVVGALSFSFCIKLLELSIPVKLDIYNASLNSDTF
jgi:hypothetical protein